MTQPRNLEGARIDCHVHSAKSADGRGTITELATQARKRGLTGFAVTDHNVFPNLAHIKLAAGRDLIILPGTEVTTKQGHCLALGIQSPVPSRRPLAETLEAIRAAGGVGVPSHPYRLLHGVGGKALDQARKNLVAIEVFNASDGSGIRNGLAQRYARQHRLGGTGGSDCHHIVEIGDAYTVFRQLPTSVDDAVAQLERRTTWGTGHGTGISIKIMKKATAFGAWVRRGFSPM